MRDGVEENRNQCNCPHCLPDAYAVCGKIKAANGNVTRAAGKVKGGSTVIAFVTDPDGYKIELI